MVGIVGIFDNLNIYEIELRKEMVKLGATKEDLFLLTKECVWNNFEKKRLPEDVALALLQNKKVYYKYD